MIESAWRSTLLMLAMAAVVAVLSVYRLPADAPWWLGAMRPFWIELWALYWVIAWAGRVGIVLLVPAGLVADALLGTPLGLHGATMACTAWTGLRFGEVFRSGSLGGQALIAAPLFLVVALLHGEVLYLVSASATPFSLFPGGLVSLLIWCALGLTLRRPGPAPALARSP